MLLAIKSNFKSPDSFVSTLLEALLSSAHKEAVTVATRGNKSGCNTCNFKQQKTMVLRQY